MAPEERRPTWRSARDGDYASLDTADEARAALTVGTTAIAEEPEHTFYLTKHEAYWLGRYLIAWSGR